jgi:hypothetical protein
MVGLPATTMTLKRGRAPPDGRSQPRVNSRCESETIRTSVLIITVGLFGQSSHRLDQRVVVSDLLYAERELYVGRAAARASVPSVVLKRPCWPQARQRNRAIAVPPSPTTAAKPRSACPSRGRSARNKCPTRRASGASGARFPGPVRTAPGRPSREPRSGSRRSRRCCRADPPRRTARRCRRCGPARAQSKAARSFWDQEARRGYSAEQDFRRRAHRPSRQRRRWDGRDPRVR